MALSAQDVDERAGLAVGMKPVGPRHTGWIEGTVKADGLSDLLGTIVYIPGTSFMARTDASGKYKISEIPDNNGYELVAERSNGCGVIWRGRADKALRVHPALATQAPEITLVALK